MKRKGFVKGIISPRPDFYKATTLSAALFIAGAALGLLSCDRRGDEGDSMRDSVVTQPRITAEDFEAEEEPFVSDNDIAMTVRSVADAINVGEAIDSLDYSFKGVLTDGSGMPLFTNMDGLPGEWEVEVVSPSVVQIRNVNTGDLISENLVGYISAALQLDDDDTLQLVSTREHADHKVSVFTFGKGTITIESQPGEDSSGSTGEKMLITMRADRELTQQPVKVDTTRVPRPASNPTGQKAGISRAQ